MNEEYKTLISRIKKSPLFPMSLGSMELFHSNVWRWLMEENKKYIKAFFENFPEISDNDSIEIKREYKHTDICIEYNKEIYIIENKIKSMLSKEQLENYSDTFKKSFKNGKYVFPFEIEGNKIDLEKWEPLYYDKILSDIYKITEEIEKLKEMSSSTILIIKEYVKMTRNLINLIKKCVEETYKNKFIIYDEIYKRLKELRIHDIVQKINCSLLKNKLEKRIIDEKLNNEKIVIETDFLHGFACLSSRWKIYYTDDKNDGYFLIGPQLQNNSFCTMIHICTEYFGIKANVKDNDGKLISIYNAVKDDVFNDLENAFYIPKYKQKNEFNKYEGIHEKKDYIALYKYKRVGINDDAIINPNFDSLCDEFIKELHKFENFENKKEDIINKINYSLKNNK